MARPSSSLGAALNVATRTFASPKILSRTQAARAPRDASIKYLLLRDVPKTALPSDILRALKDSGAVDASFSVSAITGPPPSLPRAPSLYKTWHLTLRTPAQAAAIHRLLNARPLFSSSATATSDLPSGRSGPGGPGGSGGRAKQSHSFGSDGTLIAPQSCQFIDSPSPVWVQDLIHRFYEENQAQSGSRNRQSYTRSSSVSDSGLGSRRDNTNGNGNGPEMDVDWAMMSKSGLSGRRVVVKGLPGQIKDEDVRKLGKDCGLMDGDQGLRKLPPSRMSLVSNYCLTTNSVSDAHRLVRKLHMKWYKSILHGEKYLMRAEIVY